MSFNSVMGSFGAILLLWMQAEVQERHGEDFGSGAQEVFTKYWYTLFGFWVLVVIYCIFTKDTGPTKARKADELIKETKEKETVFRP